MTGLDLWLSPSIFDWDPSADSWSVRPSAPARRAYEHLDHAEDLLARASTELDLVDVVTTLKRAVDHRLRLLNDYYCWKTIPIKRLPKEHLQRLEVFGIARHRMVTRLLGIRNSIEHGDKPPPDREHCADLLEAAWYFLRSTDPLVLRVLNTVSLAQDAIAPSSVGIEFETDPKMGWRVAFRARLLPKQILSVRHDDWLHVRATWSMHGQTCMTNRPSLQSNGPLAYIKESNDPIAINGTVMGPMNLLMRFFRIYFAAA